MNLLLFLHAFITLSLIGVILIQRSEGGGLGIGGGGGNSGSMFTARGASNLLTRITAVLATLFIGNCLLMTIITSAQVRDTASILDAGTPTAPANKS